MILCDLCNRSMRCRERDIEGKTYNICSECWSPLAAKLRGKGTVKTERETVFLPPMIETPEPKEPAKAPPGPPKIWGRAG
jgi:hypothetical protein